MRIIKESADKPNLKNKKASSIAQLGTLTSAKVLFKVLKSALNRIKMEQTFDRVIQLTGDESPDLLELINEFEMLCAENKKKELKNPPRHEYCVDAVIPVLNPNLPLWKQIRDALRKADPDERQKILLEFEGEFDGWPENNGEISSSPKKRGPLKLTLEKLDRIVENLRKKDETLYAWLCDYYWAVRNLPTVGFEENLKEFAEKSASMSVENSKKIAGMFMSKRMGFLFNDTDDDGTLTFDQNVIDTYQNAYNIKIATDALPNHYRQIAMDSAVRYKTYALLNNSCDNLPKKTYTELCFLNSMNKKENFLQMENGFLRGVVFSLIDMAITQAYWNLLQF